MSVIERWWRIDFHDHSEWTSNEENARDASEHYDYPVAGPFVLEAQQPQGAVDAYLGELVAESRAICEREGVKNLAEWIGKTVLARVTGEGQ